MSGHGISPAWVQRSINPNTGLPYQPGDPWVFTPQAFIAVFLTCGFDVDGNDMINFITNCSLSCAFDVDGNDMLNAITTINADCDIDVDDNDMLNAITVISLSCQTQLV